MNRTIILALGLSLVLPSLGNGESPSTPVGAASIDVTPSFPIRLTGYGNRTTESEGVEFPLKAKAIAIGGDDAPAVLVTVDNCAVPATVTEEVAARLKAKTGLARERFVVGSTHTHTAPALKGIIPFMFAKEVTPDQRGRIERYTEELTNKIEKVALAALADRKPAKLSWTKGELDFAMNRRVIKDGKWTGFGVTPDGPTDKTMPLLVATDEAGKPRALLAGYACHCTTLDGNFNKICGDWAGYACEAIERDHPGAVGMVIIGCGADANPEPRGQLGQAKEHGKAVAAEVARLLKGPTTPLPTQIKAQLTRIELPFGDMPTREEWTEQAKAETAAGRRARAMLARLDKEGSLPKTVDYPVQSWCFGDTLAMVFLAGEVVVDYDLRLKREFDPARLWVNAYCNDVPCYIPSKRILKEGGYEADGAMVYYGRPTRFAPEVEDLIVNAVHKIMPAAFENAK